MENIEELGFVQHMPGTYPPEPVGSGEQVVDFRTWIGGVCYAKSEWWSLARGDQPSFMAREYAQKIGCSVQFRTFAPTPWQTANPSLG